MKVDQIGGRKLFVAAILFCTTLAWFYIFHTYLLDLMLNNAGNNAVYVSVGKLLFYGAAVVSGIVGSLISERTERKRFLWFWLTLSFLSTISLTIPLGLEFSLLISILLGTSFGLGFPTCQALLTENTRVDSRGRIAGVVIFISFVVVVTILLLATPLKLGITELLMVCAGLNATGFLALSIAPIEREKGPKKSWGYILTSKSFASYAIPWLIFNIANGLLSFGKLSTDIQSVAVTGTALEFLATIFTALAAGFLADRNGRKQPMLAGLVMLGIGYVFFGIVATPESYLVYLLVEGIAWGLIAVVYMQVILGDISSQTGSKERFYALGGIMIPFLTRTAFSVGQELSGLSVPANSLSTVLSIMTFLSVIPLIRVPETLPEAKIGERKLKEHIEKLGKIIQESEETDQE